MAKGVIFDIQRFCYQDGPGIRTVVFFKGCPLRCRWCHNPESWTQEPQLMMDPQKCVLCSCCIGQCENNVFRMENNRIMLDRAQCIGCGNCIGTCGGGALRLCGRQAADDEIFAEVKKDRDFYTQSGGGVTLSGGEALAQPYLALAVLDRCKSEGIHTAIETCGENPWEVYQKSLPLCDLYLFDIKAITPELHKRWTGRDNALILHNYKRLKEAGADITVRIPLIPTVNDGEEFDCMMSFLRDNGQKKLTLIPYHRIWTNKYIQLYDKNPEADFPVFSKEEFEAYQKKASKYGFLLLD